MTVEGETLATRAPKVCPDCRVRIILIVCHSNAGYYIGAWCNYDPYCRESGYYKTKGEAKKALDSGMFGRP